MSALTQDRVKTALQEALAAQPGKKDSKWTGSDEAAAMGGVIEFLQNYMKNDGKIEVTCSNGLKTRRGPRKKSVSPLRVFLLLRNAFGVRTDSEKDDDHN